MLLRNQTKAGSNRRNGFRQEREAAKAQAILLAVVVFVVGAACGAFWLYRATQARQAPGTALQLSAGTRAVLSTLKAPVEIRFYSILNSKSTPASMIAFAGRVDQLLTEYEKEAAGKIQVVRRQTDSDSDVAAAAADGIREFVLDQGDGSFLGIAVVQQDQKQALAQLSPEWEPALEADLTRAIQRVDEAQSLTARRETAGRQTTEAAAQVRNSITNLDSVSVEEGRGLLREAALKEFRAAAAEMQAQVQEAQKRLSEAQVGKSEAEQQAAMRELQEIQTRQGQKLKDISARFQAQTTALEQLKAKQ